MVDSKHHCLTPQGFCCIGSRIIRANGSVAASLHAQLNAANADVARLEGVIGNAINPTATSLHGRIAKLTVDLAAEKATVEALRSQLSTAETNLTVAQQQAQQAQQQAQQAQQQAQEQVSNLEANQRAQNLKAVFPGGEVVPPAVVAAIEQENSPVIVTTPTPGSLRLTRGGHSAATLSGAGLRSATMRLTSGADSGKTVIYTDRELRRTLLGHYGQHKDADAPQFDVVAAGVFALTDDVTSVDGVTFSHGLRSSLSPTAQTDNTTGVIVPDPANPGTLMPTATDRMLQRDAEFFSGSIHGVGGRFYCVDDGCEITVTGTYNNNVPTAVTDDENDLETVIVTAPGGLRFRPSSSTSTVNLCDDITRCTAGTDHQYMMFGYWREDPTSAAAPYRVGVFAETMIVDGDTPQDLPNDITATYDGTAVGMYVEQDPTNPVDTHRQGEFVADVDLRLDGDASNLESQTALTGTIDDFVTTPTGGSAAPRTADRWVVSLNGMGVVSIGTLAGTTEGNWEHTYVPAHSDAGDATGESDPDPPAVTGTFNARIWNFVHLVGAFGAEKR